MDVYPPHDDHDAMTMMMIMMMMMMMTMMMMMIDESLLKFLHFFDLEHSRLVDLCNSVLCHPYIHIYNYIGYIYIISDMIYICNETIYMI